MTESQKFTLKFIAAMAATVAVTFAAALWWAGGLDDRREANCERQVEEREDNRAMWDFLIGMSPPEPDNKVGQQFVKHLAERLPHLRCVDNVPVPVED